MSQRSLTGDRRGALAWPSWVWSGQPLTRFVWKVYELIELGLDLRWGAARRGLRAAVRSASRVPNHPAAVRRLRFARSRCHLAGLAVTGRAGQPGQDGP